MVRKDCQDPFLQDCQYKINVVTIEHNYRRSAVTTTTTITTTSCSFEFVEYDSRLCLVVMCKRIGNYYVHYNMSKNDNNNKNKLDKHDDSTKESNKSWR